MATSDKKITVTLGLTEEEARVVKRAMANVNWSKAPEADAVWKALDDVEVCDDDLTCEWDADDENLVIEAA